MYGLHMLMILQNMKKQKGNNEESSPTTWGADWDNFSAADHEELTLDPIVHAAVMR